MADSKQIFNDALDKVKRQEAQNRASEYYNAAIANYGGRSTSEIIGQAQQAAQRAAVQSQPTQFNVVPKTVNPAGFTPTNIGQLVQYQAISNATNPARIATFQRQQEYATPIISGKTAEEYNMRVANGQPLTRREQNELDRYNQQMQRQQGQQTTRQIWAANSTEREKLTAPYIEQSRMDRARLETNAQPSTVTSIPEGWGDTTDKLRYIFGDTTVYDTSPYESAEHQQQVFGYFDYLTDPQKDAISYYTAQGDRESLDRYLEIIEPELMEKRAAQDSEERRQYAQENPILGTVASVGAALASPLAIPEIAANAVRETVTGEVRPANVATPSMTFVRSSSDLQEGAAKGNYDRVLNATGNEGLANIAAKASGLGTSILQNAALIGIAGGASLPIMSAIAGTQDAYKNLRDGESYASALIMGLGSGLIEAATEKYSLDNLLEMKGLSGTTNMDIFKTAAKNTLQQAGIEASEETVSSIANNLFDIVMKGDRSDILSLERELTRSGMSPEQAKREAFLQNFVYDTMESALGGAISGGLMSGGRILTSTISEGINVRDAAIELNYENAGLPKKFQVKPINVDTATRQEVIDYQDKVRKAVIASELDYQSKINDIDRNAVNEGVRNILNPEAETNNAVPEGTAELPRVSMADYANSDSPIWNNVEYDDKETQNQIMQQVHQNMVDDGRVVTVSPETLSEVAQSYPDLRNMKKSERTPILKRAMESLRDSLRRLLNGLRGSYDFEVNGNILEARLYDTGVREVLQNITQQKAGMLYESENIFNNAEYLYSTPDYEGNPNIYRWNYFYTPVQIGDNTVGVRIAVRDMAQTRSGETQSQIYHWGIKENPTLGGVSSGLSPLSPGASSVELSADASAAAPASNNTVAQENGIVNTTETGLPEHIPTFNENTVGAAQANPNSYSALQNRYGTMEPGENPFRDADVPVSTNGTDRVSQSARNFMEAEATPDSLIPTLEDAVAQGWFSYDVVGDKGAIQRARATIEQKKFNVAYEDWLSDMREGRANKDNMALGFMLYNNAANAGDQRRAMEIVTTIMNTSNNSAQIVQSMRLLKKMAPEYQLYAAERSAQHIQDMVDSKNRKAARNRQNTSSIVDAVVEAKDDIINNMVGEPFNFEYAQKVGEALAKGLSPTLREAPRKTFLQQITNELRRFASEKFPRSKRQQISAMDILRDYVQNQDFYTKAWESAQQEIRNKYGDDPYFSSFLNEGIGVSGSANPLHRIFMNALISAASESGETKNVIARQNALGFTNMAQNISNVLIAKTGATGDMAESIHSAAEDYVNQQKLTDDQKIQKIQQAEIKQALKSIGETISQAAKTGNANRENISDLITETLKQKYGFGNTDATLVSDVVNEQFSKMVQESAEKRLKSMFGEKSPRQIKETDKVMQELIDLGAFDLGSTYEAAALKRALGVEGIHVDPALAQRFQKAQTQEERDRVLAEIYSNLASQVPVTGAEKWNALRYLGMLFNPVTHVGNFVGNASFFPVHLLKDAIGTGITSAYNATHNNGAERTKAILTLNQADLGRIKAAWDDFENIKNATLGSGKYSDAFHEAIRDRKIFGIKILDKAMEGNTNLLDFGDIVFNKGTYTIALAEYLKANGIMAGDFVDALNGDHSKVSQEMIDNARAHAIEEARKGTYRDDNVISDFFSNIGKSKKTPKVVQVMVEGLFPFRRTPANIIKRSIEYSPVGVVDGIVKMVKAKNSDNPSIAMSQAIDELASGLTGMALMGLGAILRHKGILNNRPRDEEEKRLFNLIGIQNHSINIGGKNITLDWLPPSSIPLFMGSVLYDVLKDKNPKTSLKAVLSMIESAADPLIEMSMLQGLESAINDAASYSNDESALMNVAINSATNYFLQPLPTFLGRIENIFEENRQSTYVDRDSWLTNNAQKTIAKTLEKIPFIDYRQMDYIDAWGRKQSNGSIPERVFNNLLNRAYVRNVNETDVDKELSRLEKSGQDNMVPSTVPYSQKVNNEYLTADEYQTYATTKGQTAYQTLDAIISSPDYQSLSDEDKASIVSNVYSYATAKAKEAVSDYVPDGWVQKADLASGAGMDVPSYILYQQAYDTFSGGSSTQEKIEAYLDTTDYSDQQKAYLWALQSKTWAPKNNPYIEGFTIDGYTKQTTPVSYFQEKMEEGRRQEEVKQARKAARAAAKNYYTGPQ